MEPRTVETLETLPTQVGQIGLAFPETHADELNDWLSGEDRAANTIEAYRDDWRAFSTYVASIVPGVTLTAEGYLHPDHVPADPRFVVGFVKHMLDGGQKVSTIRRRVAGVGQAHIALDAADPTRVDGVKRAIRKAAKQTDTVAEKAEPLTWAGVTDVLAGIDRTTLAGKRDAAAILIGWGAALRRSELVALEWSDIRIRNEVTVGTKPVVAADGETIETEDIKATVVDVRVRSSKTSTDAVTVRVLCHQDDALSARVALDEWKEAMAAAGGTPTGPLLRSLTKHGTVRTGAMSDRSVADMLKRRATDVDLDAADQISGHSLRRGWATSAANEGVPQAAIQAHGRWKTASIAAGYAEAAKLASLDAAVSIFSMTTPTPAPAPTPTAAPSPAAPAPKKRPQRQKADGWVVELVNDDQVIVWSGHGTEVGAQRMIASLSKPWRSQGRSIQERWTWRTAPADGRTPRFSSRAEALAAAGRPAWDGTTNRLEGETIVSKPQANGLVDIVIEPSGEQIGRIAGLQAEKYETVNINGDPSHGRYIQLVLNYLFGRAPTDDLGVVQGTARDDIGTAISEIGGHPGTKWRANAVALREAIDNTEHLTELS